MIYFVTVISVITLLYCCSILWVSIGFYREQKDGNKHKSDVGISVIIPVRNEEKRILNCLKSLDNQNYNKSNFELIVVDDHSSDESMIMITTYLDKTTFNYKLYNLTDKTSKKEALKLGVEKATYSIIATTDADCELPKNWLKNIANNISETDMLLGPIMFKNNKGFLNKFQLLDMMAMQGIEFGTLHFGFPTLNNAANLTYQKEALTQVKGFDEYKTPSGDDVFLLERFVQNNKKIRGLLSKEHIVETEPEKGLIGFLNQRLRWASKAKYYKNKMLIYFSTIILFQNTIMLFIYSALPFVENYLTILVILLSSKWLIDFILLLLVASFFEKRSVLFYFIPVQLIYPMYLLVVWLASLTTTYSWKERKY